MKKIRVGVIRGGRSGEHEVSLRSAESILNALNREKYDVVPITISHEGRWEPFTISADPSTTHAVDVVFPIVHGTYGEDGTIQGLFEFFNLFNNANAAAIQTQQAQSATFGSVSQHLPGREGQVGLRLTF